MCKKVSKLWIDPKKKIIATVKRYYVDKPETTYVQIRHFMRKNEAEKSRELVFVIYTFDEFLILLGVIKSVSERALLNQSTCNIVYLKFFIESFI